MRCSPAQYGVLFRSRYLYDIDSVNVALALSTTRSTVHQPHPPDTFSMSNWGGWRG